MKAKNWSRILNKANKNFYSSDKIKNQNNSISSLSIEAQKNLFSSNETIKKKQDMLNKNTHFESRKSAHGKFEDALKKSNDNLMSQTRKDYIFSEGSAKGKNSLIKSYLQNRENPSPYSNLALKALGLETSKTNPLLETRILSGEIPFLQREQRDMVYSQSLLSEFLEHPYLNSNWIEEMSEQEREEKLKELEKFYGFSIEEILAFIEFKRKEKDIHELKQEGKEKFIKIPIEQKIDKEKLKLFESNILNKFFKNKNEDKEILSLIEKDEMDQSKYEEEIRLLEERYLESLNPKQVFNTQYETEQRFNNQTVEERKNEFAYDYPKRYQDQEGIKIYSNSYMIPEHIPPQNKIIPRKFEVHPKQKFLMPALKYKGLEELSFEELLTKLKNEELNDWERKEIMKAIYKKQEKLDITDGHLEKKILDLERKRYQKRGNNWIHEELVADRVTKESGALNGRDLMRNKGIFKQLKVTEFGINLPEQSSLGVLQFSNKEKKTVLEKLEKSKFNRNLKRATLEYLNDLSLTNLSNNNELFLAYEKAIREKDLPELSDVQVYGFVTHPFSFNNILVLMNQDFYNKYKITDPKLLKNFVKFLQNVEVHQKKIYCQFLDLFNPDTQMEKETVSILTDLYINSDMWKINKFNISKLLIQNQFQSEQNIDFSYLSCLEDIHIRDEVSSISFIDSELSLNSIMSNESLALFISDILVSFNTVDALRLLVLSKYVLLSLNQNKNILALILRFVTSFDVETLDYVLNENLKKVLKFNGKYYQALLLENNFKKFVSEVEKINSDIYYTNNISLNLEENQETKEMQTIKHIVNFDSVIFFKKKELMKGWKLLNEDQKLREKFKGVLESNETDKKIEEYFKSAEIFKKRTGSQLSSIFSNENRIMNQETLSANYQILNDYYHKNVKNKVIQNDYTQNEYLRTASRKNKSLKGKKLNFSNRNLKYFYSKQKESDEDPKKNEIILQILQEKKMLKYSMKNIYIFEGFDYNDSILNESLILPKKNENNSNYDFFDEENKSSLKKLDLDDFDCFDDQNNKSNENNISFNENEKSNQNQKNDFDDLDDFDNFDNDDNIFSTSSSNDGMKDLGFGNDLFKSERSENLFMKDDNIFKNVVSKIQIKTFMKDLLKEKTNESKSNQKKRKQYSEYIPNPISKKRENLKLVSNHILSQIKKVESNLEHGDWMNEETNNLLAEINKINQCLFESVHEKKNANFTYINKFSNFWFTFCFRKNKINEYRKLGKLTQFEDLDIIIYLFDFVMKEYPDVDKLLDYNYISRVEKDKDFFSKINNDLKNFLLSKFKNVNLYLEFTSQNSKNNNLKLNLEENEIFQKLKVYHFIIMKQKCFIKSTRLDRMELMNKIFSKENEVKQSNKLLEFIKILISFCDISYKNQIESFRPNQILLESFYEIAKMKLINFSTIDNNVKLDQLKIQIPLLTSNLINLKEIEVMQNKFIEMFKLMENFQYKLEKNEILVEDLNLINFLTENKLLKNINNLEDNYNIFEGNSSKINHNVENFFNLDKINSIDLSEFRKGYKISEINNYVNNLYVRNAFEFIDTNMALSDDKINKKKLLKYILTEKDDKEVIDKDQYQDKFEYEHENEENNFNETLYKEIIDKNNKISGNNLVNASYEEKVNCQSNIFKEYKKKKLCHDFHLSSTNIVNQTILTKFLFEKKNNKEQINNFDEVTRECDFVFNRIKNFLLLTEKVKISELKKNPFIKKVSEILKKQKFEKIDNKNDKKYKKKNDEKNEKVDLNPLINSLLDNIGLIDHFKIAFSDQIVKLKNSIDENILELNIDTDINLNKKSISNENIVEMVEEMKYHSDNFEELEKKIFKSQYNQLMILNSTMKFFDKNFQKINLKNLERTFYSIQDFHMKLDKDKSIIFPTFLQFIAPALQESLTRIDSDLIGEEMNFIILDTFVKKIYTMLLCYEKDLMNIYFLNQELDFINLKENFDFDLNNENQMSEIITNLFFKFSYNDLFIRFEVFQNYFNRSFSSENKNKLNILTQTTDKFKNLRVEERDILNFMNNFVNYSKISSPILENKTVFIYIFELFKKLDFLFYDPKQLSQFFFLQTLALKNSYFDPSILKYENSQNFFEQIQNIKLPEGFKVNDYSLNQFLVLEGNKFIQNSQKNGKLVKAQANIYSNYGEIDEMREIIHKFNIDFINLTDFKFDEIKPNLKSINKNKIISKRDINIYVKKNFQNLLKKISILYPEVFEFKDSLFNFLVEYNYQNISNKKVIELIYSHENNILKKLLMLFFSNDILFNSKNENLFFNLITFKDEINFMNNNIEKILTKDQLDEVSNLDPNSKNEDQKLDTKMFIDEETEKYDFTVEYEIKEKSIQKNLRSYLTNRQFNTSQNELMAFIYLKYLQENQNNLNERIFKSIVMDTIFQNKKSEKYSLLLEIFKILESNEKKMFSYELFLLLKKNGIFLKNEFNIRLYNIVFKIEVYRDDVIESYTEYLRTFGIDSDFMFGMKILEYLAEANDMLSFMKYKDLFKSLIFENNEIRMDEGHEIEYITLNSENFIENRLEERQIYLDGNKYKNIQNEFNKFDYIFSNKNKTEVFDFLDKDLVIEKIQNLRNFSHLDISDYQDKQKEFENENNEILGFEEDEDVLSFIFGENLVDDEHEILIDESSDNENSNDNLNNFPNENLIPEFNIFKDSLNNFIREINIFFLEYIKVNNNDPFTLNKFKQNLEYLDKEMILIKEKYSEIKNNFDEEFENLNFDLRQSLDNLNESNDLENYILKTIESFSFENEDISIIQQYELELKLNKDNERIEKSNKSRMEYHEYLEKKYSSYIFDISVRYDIVQITDPYIKHLMNTNAFDIPIDIINVMVYYLKKNKKIDDLIEERLNPLLFTEDFIERGKENHNYNLPLFAQNQLLFMPDEELGHRVMDMIFNFRDKIRKYATLYFFLMVDPSPASDNPKVIQYTLEYYEMKKNILGFKKFLISKIKKNIKFNDKNFRLALKIINEVEDDEKKLELKKILSILYGKDLTEGLVSIKNKTYIVEEEDEENNEHNEFMNEFYFNQIEKYWKIFIEFESRKRMRKYDKPVAKKKFITQRFNRIKFFGNPYDEEVSMEL